MKKLECPWVWVDKVKGSFYNGVYWNYLEKYEPCDSWREEHFDVQRVEHI